MLDEFYKIIYKLMVSIFSVIDFLKDMVGVLSGMEGSGDEILLGLVKGKDIMGVFFVVLLIGFILLAFFTILAIIKSETIEPEKTSKGLILGRSVKSFISFLIIPFGLIAGILLANVIMTSINSAMSGYFVVGGEKMGGELLVTVGHDAYIYDDISRSGIERAIVQGEINYADMATIATYYKIQDFNYFIGILGGIVMLAMLLIAAIAFVQRIFDVILLFIIAPITVSTIPFDEGTRFSAWRELMLGKVLGAYGIVLSLNIFFLIIPVVSSKIVFDSTFKNAMLKLLLIIGGTFAVTKASIMISILVGSKTGKTEIYGIISNLRSMKAMTMTAAAGAVKGAGSVVGGTLGGYTFFKTRKKLGTIQAFSKIAKPSQSTIPRPKPGLKGKMATTGGVVKSLVSGGIIKAKKDISGMKNIDVEK